MSEQMTKGDEEYDFALDENGRPPTSIFYNPPRQMPIQDAIKGRRLPGKARRRARRAAARPTEDRAELTTAE